MNSSPSEKNTSEHLGFDEYFERQEKADLQGNEAAMIKKTGKWTAEEDELLNKYVPIYGEKQWRKIAEHIPGRSSIQCLHRWTKILKPGLVKGPWTPEEDQKLIAWVRAEGPTKWASAAAFIKGRSGKQCRERWFNNLCPGVKKGAWSEDEDEMIFQLYQKYGSSWSKIAKFIPGRTENAIKNRFYSTLRKIAADKKKTFLENSTNDIKRELSDSFSTDDTNENKLSVNKEDPMERKKSMQIEGPAKATEQGDLEKKDAAKTTEKGSPESSGKNDSASLLLMDGSQNTLYKLLNQEAGAIEPIKEPRASHPDSKPKSAEQEKKNGGDRMETEAAANSSKSKSDAAFENYLKGICDNDFAKKFTVKRSPSQQDNGAMENFDDDDEYDTLESLKKKSSYFAKNNTKDNNSENIQNPATLGLDFEKQSSLGTLFNLSNRQQETTERNLKVEGQFSNPSPMRTEMNSKALQSQTRAPNPSSPVLSGASKLLGDSYRERNNESQFSLNRRDVPEFTNKRNNSNPGPKDNTWNGPDSRQSAFIKREPGNYERNMKSLQNEDFGQTFRKSYQLNQGNRELPSFENLQSRTGNSGMLGRSFSQPQYPFAKSMKYENREDQYDDEEPETPDSVHMSIANELLSSLKFGGTNAKNNSLGLLKNFSQPGSRELGMPGPQLVAPQSNRSLTDESTVSGDDKISLLFQQLHSLESLLSTTRNELTRLDKDPKQGESLVDTHASRLDLNFGGNMSRMLNMRRDDDIYGEYLMKRR